MPVDAEAFQKWAQGRLSNSMSNEDDGKEGGPPEDGDEGGEDGDPEGRNLLWAGEYDGDPSTISPEQAEELLDFLATSEPEIHEAVLELAAAIVEGEEKPDDFDPNELDGGDGSGEEEEDDGGFDEDTPGEETGGPVESAKHELMEAVQNLNPEYPELTSGQREKASNYIGEEIKSFGHPAKDSPDWRQAVAIGLSRARAE